MFDDLQEPKDMFGEDPVSPTSPSSSTVNSQPLTPASPQGQSSPSPSIVNDAPSTNKLRTLLMVLIPVLAVAASGYIAYRFMVRDTAPQTIQDTGTNEDDTNENVPIDEEETGKGSEEENDAPVALVDSDGDGLSNDEERKLGTSIARPDTDNDGLGDKEEITVYKTNPLIADTDGDTYADGAEVKNGYNPNGSGKLLEVPAL